MGFQEGAFKKMVSSYLPCHRGALDVLAPLVWAFATSEGGHHGRKPEVAVESGHGRPMMSMRKEGMGGHSKPKRMGGLRDTLPGYGFHGFSAMCAGFLLKKAGDQWSLMAGIRGFKGATGGFGSQKEGGKRTWWGFYNISLLSGGKPGKLWREKEEGKKPGEVFEGGTFGKRGRPKNWVC